MQMISNMSFMLDGEELLPMKTETMHGHEKERTLKNGDEWERARR